MNKRRKQLKMVTKDNVPVKIFQVKKRTPLFDIKKIASDLKKTHSSKVAQNKQTKSDIINKIRIQSTRVPPPPKIRVVDTMVIDDSSSDEDNDLSITENIHVMAMLSPELSHSFYVPVEFPIRSESNQRHPKSPPENNQLAKTYRPSEVPKQFQCYVRIEPLPELKETQLLANESPGRHSVSDDHNADWDSNPKDIIAESTLELKIESCYTIPTIETPPPEPLVPPMVEIPSLTDKTINRMYEKTMRVNINAEQQLEDVERRQPHPTPPPSIPPPQYETITPPLRPLIKLRNINDLLEKRSEPPLHLMQETRVPENAVVVNRDFYHSAQPNMRFTVEANTVRNMHTLHYLPQPHQSSMAQTTANQFGQMQPMLRNQLIGVNNNNGYNYNVPHQHGPDYHQYQQQQYQHLQTMFQNNYYNTQNPHSQPQSVHYGQLNYQLNRPHFHQPSNEPVNMTFQNVARVESVTM